MKILKVGALFSATCFVLFWSFTAFSSPYKKLPHEIIDVPTEDGAILKAAFFKQPGWRQKGTSTVLVIPGLGATGESIGPQIETFVKDGMNVLSGHTRGAGLGEYESGVSGVYDGLESIFKYDAKALLDAAISLSFSNEEIAAIRAGESSAQDQFKIIVVGHSMGGMTIMGLLSDPDLAPKYTPFIRAVATIGSPHRLAGPPLWNRKKGKREVFKLPWWVRHPTKLLMYLSAVAEKRGMKAVGFHRKFFDSTKADKEQGNILKRSRAKVLEGTVLHAGRLVLNTLIVRRQKMEHSEAARIILKGSGGPPLDLIRSFGNAVLDPNGDFRRLTEVGTRIIREDRTRPLLLVPERIEVPFMVVAAEGDILVPLESQYELFSRLGSEIKFFKKVKNVGHIGIVVGGMDHYSTFTEMRNFLEDPNTYAATHSRKEIIVYPFPRNCEKILKGL